VEGLPRYCVAMPAPDTIDLQSIAKARSEWIKALEIAPGLARVVIDGGILQHGGSFTVGEKEKYGACKHS
jgi:hypothetical protein